MRQQASLPVQPGGRWRAGRTCALPGAAVAVLMSAMLLATPTDAAKTNSPQTQTSTEAIDTTLYDAETGYRIAHYRSAVPDDVPGGTIIQIEDIDPLIKTQNAILVDVMPSTGFGFSPKTGKWRLSKIHDDIPGSTWLPDVGKGRISNVLDRYFQDNLKRLTAGDKTRALIIYCQSDCWMAWNAVQRAHSYGYTSVYWYPDGVDGWRDYDRPLTKAVPIPVTMTTPETAK